MKLGTHVDSGQMYRVYQNQAAAYLSLYFFIFLFLKFSNIKIFRHTALTLDYTGIRLLLLIHHIISSFSFLTNYQTLKIFITFFSGTVRSRRLKLGTHMDSGQMYRVYQNQAAAAYLSLYFFFLQDSNIKIFITLFSGTVNHSLEG